MEIISVCSEQDMREYVARHGRATRPQSPAPIQFPIGLLGAAERHLRTNGHYEQEQVVLWGGYTTQHDVVLTSLLLPETEASWGWVHVLPEEQPYIANWLRAHGQLLFVEAHTHGHGPRSTELSDADRRHPVGRQDGFLTLIVPAYARDGIQFSRAGVWECRKLVWARLTASQVQSRLHVLADEEVQRVLE